VGQRDDCRAFDAKVGQEVRSNRRGRRAWRALMSSPTAVAATTVAEISVSPRLSVVIVPDFTKAAAS
jgi:sigma54-dependent transcription regulator